MVRLPFISSTRAVPETVQVPRHIAIIMDGNGRWARKRLMPRVAGHAKGVDSVRDVVRTCLDHKVDYLTLFAFSSVMLIGLAAVFYRLLNGAHTPYCLYNLPLQ